MLAETDQNSPVQQFWWSKNSKTRGIFQPIGWLALADPLVDLGFWCPRGWFEVGSTMPAATKQRRWFRFWKLDDNLPLFLWNAPFKFSKTKCLQPKVDIWIGHIFIHFSSIFLGRLISDWTEECNTAVGVVVQPVRSLRLTDSTLFITWQRFKPWDNFGWFESRNFQRLVLRRFPQPQHVTLYLWGSEGYGVHRVLHHWRVTLFRGAIFGECKRCETMWNLGSDSFRFTVEVYCCHIQVGYVTPLTFSSQVGYGADGMAVESI